MPLSVNQTISYKPDLIDITKEYGGVDLIFFAHQMLAAGYQSAVVSVPGCKNFMVSCEQIIKQARIHGGRKRRLRFLVNSSGGEFTWRLTSVFNRYLRAGTVNGNGFRRSVKNVSKKKAVSVAKSNKRRA